MLQYVTAETLTKMLLFDEKRYKNSPKTEWESELLVHTSIKPE